MRNDVQAGERFSPVIILPTYNNASTLVGVLSDVHALGLPMIVTNDGSTDQTAEILERWTKAKPNVRILTHLGNHGKAAALRTSFSAAIASGHSHAVTIDTDGQLDPKQIPQLLQIAQSHPHDLVLGVRDARRADYPGRSRLGRAFSNTLIRLETGHRISDSQCGLRVYPLAAVQGVRCRADRFGFETEIISRLIWLGLAIQESPISCQYFSGTKRVSHLNPWRETARAIVMHSRLIPRGLFFRLHHLIKRLRRNHSQPDSGSLLTASTMERSATGFADPSMTDPSASGFRPSTIPTSIERFLILAIITVGVLLRVNFALRFRVCNDEPQHLHVIWGWMHGLTQYRDIFDNHAPLFHLLCWPLGALLGDRADLLVLMRLAMLPVYIITVWATYKLGKSLFQPRIGWWSAAGIALFPPFYFGSLEFRTDDLWAMFWVLSMATVFGGPLTVKRGLLAGILFGATLCTSMKSVVLLTSLFTATVAAVIMYAPSNPFGSVLRRHLRGLGAATIGALVIPVILIAWFNHRDALGSMYDCVIEFNAGAKSHGSGSAWRPWLFLPAVVGLAIVTFQYIVRREPGSASVRNRVIAVLFVGLVIAVFVTLWPMITHQDFLPVWPVVIVLITALVADITKTTAAAASRLAPGRAVGPYANLLLIAVVELGVVIALGPWKDRMGKEIRTWQSVFTLTRPEEFVMDFKGELLFRRRAHYCVLESITRDRMKQGLLKLDVTSALIKTGTCVVGKRLKGYPKPDVLFIKSNFVLVGPFYVAGQHLTSSSPDLPTAITFNVNIPAEYVVITPEGTAHGRLDGQPMDESRLLQVGKHTYEPAPGEQRLVMMWARAAKSGFSPFNVAEAAR